MRRFLIIAVCIAASLLLTAFIDLTPPDPAGDMILVNKTHSLSWEYVPPDLTVCNVLFASGTSFERSQMRKDAADALEDMFNAAAEAGITLYAVSGYRSYGSQAGIYATRLEQTGLGYVSRYVAKPGQSEHQTGLAMDLSDHDTRWLDESFADTEAYRWLKRWAWKYGFIIRYPEDGEEITGYAFEPWHVRYLGEAAEAVYRSGLCYETWLETRKRLTYRVEHAPVIAPPQ